MYVFDVADHEFALVHKILLHGSKIIDSHLLPIGELFEEGKT